MLEGLGANHHSTGDIRFGDWARVTVLMKFLKANSTGVPHNPFEVIDLRLMLTTLRKLSF
jgi:hypothetical protein